NTRRTACSGSWIATRRMSSSTVLTMTAFRMSRRRYVVKTRFGINCSATRALLIAAAISTSMAISCRPPEKYARFVELPSAQAESEFRRLPVEEQLDAYLFLSTRIEPPKRGYADLVAERGRTVVPIVLNRIFQATDDKTRE